MKIEKNSSLLADIEVTSNNVKLLSEMLKSYCDGTGSSNDLELIKELYTTVKRMEPKIKTMLSQDIPENEDTVSKYLINVLINLNTMQITKFNLYNYYYFNYFL